MKIDPKVLSVTLSEVLVDITHKNHTIEEIAMSHDIRYSLLTLTPNTGLFHSFRGFKVCTYKEWPENVIRVFDQSYRLLALIEINDDGTTTTHVITDTE